MIPIDLRLQITEMLNAYAHALDDDRLEEWPDFFTDDGIYRIDPAREPDAALTGRDLSSASAAT